VRGALAGLRDATELPILWRGGGTPEDAMRAGADAVFVVAEEHDETATVWRRSRRMRQS
jgi:hypothetical protein